MDQHTYTKFASELLQDLNSVTENLEDYLTPNMHSAKLKEMLKKSYDFIKDSNTSSGNGLPELIIDSFGHEEIWSQLELETESQEKNHIISVAEVLASKDKLFDENKTSDLESEAESLSDEDQDEEEEEENEPMDDDENEKEFSDMETESVEDTNSKSEGNFFNMKDMENFLDDQDKKEMKQTSKKGFITDDSGAESDSSVDLFIPSDDDSENDENSSKKIHYKDFFNAGQKNDKEEFPAEESDVEISPFDTGIESDDAEKQEELLSALEERKLRLKKKIEHLEENILKEKSWQLKGETSARDRPPNALLEEVLEFDVSTRPPLIVTEQTTQTLEDIIIQRIKNRAWDSVKRKIKPVEDVPEFKKKLALDQEKSKQSLAEIYEKDYLKQKEMLEGQPDDDKTDEMSAEKIACTAAVDNLFSKLDALSHFYFTPRLVKPDVKIVSNLPAITMEEVAPVATSEATLLAPEEVKTKQRGEVLAKEERTDTDRKRERRQKKIHQRKRKQEREAKDVESEPRSKKHMKTLVSQVVKDRNVSVMTASATAATKSSEKFFNQLQEQVKNQVATAKHTSENKKKSKFTVKKLKL